MNKKYIFLLVLMCLLVGMFFVTKPIPTLQDDKKDDKITKEVSDDEKYEETDKIEGTNDTEDIEIPLESGVENDKSQTEVPESDEDDNDGDGDVELPTVPIQ